ncbi:MAG: orotate phosphoribosyltransferase [Thermoanaerobaculia bacterium]
MRSSEEKTAIPTPDEMVAALEGCDALRRGHFLLSSGLHSPAYVQCALYLSDPRRAARAGEALAALLAGTGVESILSPALGGVVIGHEVARALGVPFRFCERDGAQMALRRGFTIGSGERVAIVEDVVTTGKSTLETASLARSCGARVVAIASIIDRSGGRHGFEVPYVSLLRLDLPAYEAGDCPLCREGSVAIKPGSRPMPAT